MRGIGGGESTLSPLCLLGMREEWGAGGERVMRGGGGGRVIGHAYTYIIDILCNVTNQGLKNGKTKTG